MHLRGMVSNPLFHSFAGTSPTHQSPKSCPTPLPSHSSRGHVILPWDPSQLAATADFDETDEVMDVAVVATNVELRLMSLPRGTALLSS